MSIITGQSDDHYKNSYDKGKVPFSRHILLMKSNICSFEDYLILVGIKKYLDSMSFNESIHIRQSLLNKVTIKYDTDSGIKKKHVNSYCSTCRHTQRIIKILKSSLNINLKKIFFGTYLLNLSCLAFDLYFQVDLGNNYFVAVGKWHQWNGMIDFNIISCGSPENQKSLFSFWISGSYSSVIKQFVKICFL